jgi:hypothetical protein
VIVANKLEQRSGHARLDAATTNSVRWQVCTRPRAVVSPSEMIAAIKYSQVNLRWSWIAVVFGKTPP